MTNNHISQKIWYNYLSMRCPQTLLVKGEHWIVLIGKDDVTQFVLSIRLIGMYLGKLGLSQIKSYGISTVRLTRLLYWGHWSELNTVRKIGLSLTVISIRANSFTKFDINVYIYIFLVFSLLQSYTLLSIHYLTQSSVSTVLWIISDSVDGLVPNDRKYIVLANDVRVHTCCFMCIDKS